MYFIIIHNGWHQIANDIEPIYSARKHKYYTLQDVSGGTKELKFTKHVYGNTHISMVIHYQTTLQLVRASRRSTIMCC